MEKRNLMFAFLLVLMAFAVSCKKDAEVNKDTFKIEHENIEATTQSVRITGTYDYAGTIDGITLELGRQADLMDADAHRALMEGTDFSVEVKNLRTNTTYYYRYLVDYGGKAPYRTDIKSFKTVEYNLPEVVSKEVISVGVNRAEVSGEVMSDGGGDAVTLRGICWSTSHNPSVGDEYVNSGEGIGTFTCELTNLQPEKTYYARAFAGNSMGVSYGEELTFVTLAMGSLPEVHTLGISGNAMLQATVNGEVTLEGTSAVLERGICYGKEHYPTTSGLHVSSGSGAGEFSCQLTNLEANETYYVRAYAINSLGIAYGGEMSFVAMTETTVPVVLTNEVNDITVSSATGHGNVVSDGGAAITRRGLCWSTEHNPTVDDTHADCGDGVGEFSALIPHLIVLETYYVRAFAENAIGMSYGEEVSFTVGQHAPSIDQFYVDGTMAVYRINDNGGVEVTDHGVCWSTSPSPTNTGNHASGGFGAGEFSVEMTGLQPGTTYYVRVYAVYSAGVVYSEEVSYTTESVLPIVYTLQIHDINNTSAFVSGSVTNDGGAPVTERGVCWSIDQNPTIEGNHESNGSGIGFFDVTLTNLSPNTTYYVRAYAINSAGIAYGTEMNFTTTNGEWIFYDNGTYSDGIGTGGSTVYWAAMFPAASIAPYAGTILTKVAMYETPSLNTGAITVAIYLGGTTAPQTMVSTQTFNPTGSEGFHEVALNTPVPVDGTQNLWIVYSEYGTYPATACTDTGDPNGRWISLDNESWYDVVEYGLNYTWMIRGYVTSGARGTMELKPITNKPQTPVNGKTINLGTFKKAKQ